MRTAHPFVIFSLDPTPIQQAVFAQGSELLGGGIIGGHLRSLAPAETLYSDPQYDLVSMSMPVFKME